MAQPLIKFYRSAEAPTSAPIGSLWFSTEDSTIKVRKAVTDGNPITDWESYGGDSIEIAESDSTNQNFLTLEDGALAVRGVKTSATTTTEDIVVIGGPLADDVNGNTESWPDAWKDSAGRRKIPAGATVQEIFEKLFNQTLYPSTATKPAITISGNKDLGLQEIGASVTLPALSTTTTVGKFNASYTNVTLPNPTGVTWSNKTISVAKNTDGTDKITGFTNLSVTSGETISETTAKIVKGQNSVTYTASGSYTAPSNYPKTNLNSDATDTKYSWAAGTDDAPSVSTKAYGVYPIFTSGVKLESTSANTAAGYGSSNQNKFPNLINYTKTNLKGEYIGETIYIGFGSPATGEWLLYLPADEFTVSTIQGLGLNPLAPNPFSINTKFKKLDTTATIKVLGSDVTYNVYKSTDGTGAMNVKLTLKKG